MIRLTIEQVLNMHKMMLAETGGTDGVRDMGMLDMALNSAFQSFDGQYLYFYHWGKSRPFVDENKRAGLFVILVFLELNGIELTYTQQELVELGLGLADGSIDSKALHQQINKYKLMGNI